MIGKENETTKELYTILGVNYQDIEQEINSMPENNLKQGLDKLINIINFNLWISK